MKQKIYTRLGPLWTLCLIWFKFCLQFFLRPSIFSEIYALTFQCGPIAVKTSIYHHATRSESLCIINKRSNSDAKILIRSALLVRSRSCVSTTKVEKFTLIDSRTISIGFCVAALNRNLCVSPRPIDFELCDRTAKSKSTTSAASIQFIYIVIIIYKLQTYLLFVRIGAIKPGRQS